MRVKRETGFTRRLGYLMFLNRTTYEELGDVLGLCKQSVHNYASGRNEPSIDTLIKIANYFKVSVGYLVGEEYDR